MLHSSLSPILFHFCHRLLSSCGFTQLSKMLLTLAVALMSCSAAQSAIYRRQDFSPSSSESVVFISESTPTARATFDVDDFVVSPKFFVRTDSSSSAFGAEVRFAKKSS